MPAVQPPESYGIQLFRQLIQQNKRIFDMKDAASAASIENIPHASLNKILSNLAKRGRILRLRRGLYTCIGWLPEETHLHPFIISNHLVQPSAISHWSALQQHGLTEQIPQVITASTPSKVVFPSMRQKKATSKEKHTWEVEGIHYEYISIQKKHFFGIEKTWIDEHFQIAITDKERTLLDIFIFPKIFGGMGEALGILENALPILDIEKLISYAIQYNKKSLIKRLGWTLEYLEVDSHYLLPLQEIPMHYFCRLDPQGTATGTCDSHWMIQNNLTPRK